MYCYSYIVPKKYVVSPETRLYWGDLEYFMGTGTIANGVCFVASIMAITCQLYSYHNYRNGVEPRDLRVLQMVAGLRAPVSLGIHDTRMVLTLRDMCRKILFITKYSTLSMLFITVALFQTSCWSKVTLKQWLIIGLPNSILWGIWNHYVHAIINYQTIYYYIITYYLESKLKAINASIKNISKYKDLAMNAYILLKIVPDIDTIYAEISEYNRIFWCKFLGIFWLCTDTIIAMVALIAFLGGEREVIIRVMLTTYMIIFIVLLIFIIQISDYVVNEPRKTYKLLNSYMSNTQYKPVMLKLKVQF